MATTIRYIFSYLSPYSYIADCRMENILEPFDVEIDYIPVVPPPRADGKRMKERPEAEATYIREDATRVAKRFGIRFQWYDGYPDCEKMCIGFHAVRHLGGDWHKYHKAAFAARFAHPVDPVAEDTLRALAAAARVDGDAFLAAVDSDEVQQAYRAKAMEGVKCGLFGVPIYVLPSGERFWGQDRLAYLALALKDGRV